MKRRSFIGMITGAMAGLVTAKTVRGEELARDLAEQVDREVTGDVPWITQLVEDPLDVGFATDLTTCDPFDVGPISPFRYENVAGRSGLSIKCSWCGTKMEAAKLADGCPRCGGPKE